MNNFVRFGFHACSACSGDYEDPDESSWSSEENDEEEFRAPREEEFGEAGKDSDAEA